MKEPKPYRLGISVGRFQTLHTGHVQMLSAGIAICERFCVLVGSSQESGTNKNPFSYEQRERMLRAVFGDRIEIYPLPDVGIGNVAGWGDYVLEQARAYTGEQPELAVSSRETRRASWYEDAAMTELIVPRDIDISATDMRDFFLQDDRESWQRYTSPVLWPMYDELRQAVLEAQSNTDTMSI